MTAVSRTLDVLVPRATPSQAGSNRDGPSSISGLLSTLIPVFVGATILVGAFILLRLKLPRVFSPRTYLGVLRPHERSPEPSPGLFGWVNQLFTFPDDEILAHSSLDNFLWLRFFKILTGCSLVGCLITWPVLFPVNATGGGGESGLNILSFSNVNSPARYYAHTFVAWLFLGFVMFVISRETLFYVHLRQAYFLSPLETSRISSRTVLFTNVPDYYQSEEHLRHIFQRVQHIWLCPNTEYLQASVEDRDNAMSKLEAAEVKMAQNHIKRQRKEGNQGKLVNGHESGHQHRGIPDIHNDDRPTHRVKRYKLPIGETVDSLRWAQSELQRLVPEADRFQREARIQRRGKVGACFIEFETVRDAQTAFQQVAHHDPLHMTAEEVGMIPEQVLWDNIALPWWNVKLKLFFFTAIIALLCLFWTIPVAFIGVITNVQALTDALPWLGFINSIPSPVLGVVTGLLPTLLLSVLMKLVPILCTILAKTFEPTLGAVQLRVQNWYFPFQVIQVFIVTTFTSGAAAVVQKILANPVQAPALLAKNLPKASNFYIAYFILFGLMTAALQILNIMPLLTFTILGRILDKTPKKMYNRYIALAGLGWGSLYPKFTNLGVIALAYSCIAPLVLGFATVGFALLYLAYRYNVFFTLDTTADTKGRCYARALQQLTVGIYLSEICLIGLFAINSGSSLLSLGPLILTLILLALTVLWQLQLRQALHKLIISLPNDLLAEEYLGEGHTMVDEEKSSAQRQPHSPESPSQDSAQGESGDLEAVSGNPPPKTTSFASSIKAFLLPSDYATPSYLSKHVLSREFADPLPPYTTEERSEAYLRPCIVSPPPIIWFPRDSYGISQAQMESLREALGDGVQVADEAAWFDDGGKVQWDSEDLKHVPLWEDGVVY